MKYLMRLSVAILVVLVFSFSASADPGIPFVKGERIGDGWRVDRQEKRPEYIRVSFLKSNERQTIEINLLHDSPGSWVTKYYELQPAHGFSPPESLLQATTARMAEFESHPGHELLLDSHLPPKQEAGEYYIGFLIALALVPCIWLIYRAKSNLWRWKEKPSERITAKIRVTLKYALTASPLILLLIYFSMIGFRLYEINHIDFDAMDQDLANRFIADVDSRLTFETRNGRLGYDGGLDQHFIPIDSDSGDFRIGIFGASSLLSQPEPSAFSKELEKILGQRMTRSVKVFNFGVAGTTSGSVLARIAETLKNIPLDLVIVYMGHNDYTNTYHNIVLPYYDLVV
jgi:hypothetical protein